MQFLFTESNGHVLFLVCQETIAVLKEHNLKRHYQSRHEAKCNSIKGQQREDKIKQLLKLVHRQQTALQSCCASNKPLYKYCALATNHSSKLVGLQQTALRSWCAGNKLLYEVGAVVTNRSTKMIRRQQTAL